MTFLNPMALAWLAIGIPVIALYILRIRRRRQVVPTLLFWDRVFQDAQPRSLWRTMRHWLSLLMQLAFIALLVAALANPVPSGEGRRPVHHVIVMDISASMQARDGSGSRLDKAKTGADRIIRAMRDHDQATIIAAGVQPTIVCGRTHHQPTLHRAIDSLAARDVAAKLKPAVSLAQAIESKGHDRSITLLTDFGGERSLDKERAEDLAVVAVGDEVANVAITAFAVRPRSDNPFELQGMIRVANFTDDAREVELRLLLDDLLHDVLVIPLEAGEQKLRTFEMLQSEGKRLTAELAETDALSVDDRAVARLPQVHEQNVLLVSSSNLFLESVIASHPWMRSQAVEPPVTPERVETADILVFHQYVPDALPQKPCFYINPQNDSRLWTLGKTLDNPLVSEFDKEDELLRHVNLQNVTFHRAQAVTPQKPARELVSSFEHPLLLGWDSASPPVVLLAVDINQSDLPWRTAFPILVQNTLNYLAGAETEAPSSYGTGQRANVELAGTDASETELTAVDQAGRLVPIVKLGGRFQVGPVDSAGVVTVSAGEETIPIPFNLASASESDLRLESESSEGATPATVDLAPVASWPWWVILSIAAVVLSTVEWCLHQRRIVD